MKLLICSVYDAAVGAYMQPFFCRSKSEAIRSFSDAVGAKESQFCAHPEDYTLMCVGAWDDATADLVPISNLEKLITGNECRNVNG